VHAGGCGTATGAAAMLLAQGILGLLLSLPLLLLPLVVLLLLPAVSVLLLLYVLLLLLRCDTGLATPAGEAEVYELRLICLC
jgi:hypothetical protein